MASSLSASVSAPAEQAYFYLGNDLWPILLAAERSESNYAQSSVADAQYLAMANGFVAGVADSQGGVRVCIPSQGVSTSQARAIVSKFFRDHPENWNLPAAAIVSVALEKVWPCKR